MILFFALKDYLANSFYFQNYSINQLLTKCWKSIPNKRPIFNEIIEEMKTTKFIENMKVDKKDIDHH